MKPAMVEEFPGNAWQRCGTHFMCNLLGKVLKNAQGLVATLVRADLCVADEQGGIGKARFGL